MILNWFVASLVLGGIVTVWFAMQVACISAGPLEEVFSFSFGGIDGNFAAAGYKSKILFWDWRTMKQTACLEESHMEDATLVQFVPGHENKLLSASVDGLMCLFDTSGDINDDDHLLSVFNTGTSIGKVGFFGEANKKLWCLTQIETLSVWDWNKSRTEANFDDARALASESWTLDRVDYFVNCHYSADEDCLWLLPCKIWEYQDDWVCRGRLSRRSYGHCEECVADVQRTWQKRLMWHFWMDRRGRWAVVLLVDDKSLETNGSWVSTTLVEKSNKTHRKRQSPY